jgi:hypothetical protein
MSESNNLIGSGSFDRNNDNSMFRASKETQVQ